MQRNIDNFQYNESYLAHGYKELTIPPGPDGSWQMEKNALHIWPRKSFMMIALPNPDGSFTCTLFWEFEGPRSFATTKTEDDVRRFFDEEFPDAVPLMPTLLEDFKNNPTGSLVTIRCAPWYYRDRVCLLGDAAHAVVPFYGQGMNAAFEDCVVLDECLDKVSRQPRARIRRIFLSAEKKMPTRSPIWRSAILLRCAIKLPRGHSAQKKNSITCSRLRCLACICRFTQWSPSRASHMPKRRAVRACKTEFFSLRSSLLVLIGILVLAVLLSGPNDNENLKPADLETRRFKPVEFYKAAFLRLRFGRAASEANTLMCFLFQNRDNLLETLHIGGVNATGNSTF